ncbi:MAG: hypothetical protein KC418_18280 [Anaerolineales bacterium]|nr:hypothetical protein [Anaerolineales bacterium]MCB8952102.1 hypothetical protein [Ardenticatenales bacterium]
MVTRVADMSVDELRTLIQETITQTLAELLRDPDEGLLLREDIETALRLSIEAVMLGEKTMATDDVAARLGLDW